MQNQPIEQLSVTYHIKVELTQQRQFSDFEGSSNKICFILKG